MLKPAPEWVRPIVHAKTDHLSVEFPPAGALLALRRHLIVPWSTIESAEAQEAPWPPALHLERVGAHLPRVMAYGTFYVEGERRFYAFLKGERTVALRLRDHPFDRVVLGTEDPETFAATIRAHLEAASGPSF